MMTSVVFIVCLLGATMAAPVQESESEEQVIAQANAALRWMEMYRLFQRQAAVGNPFLPQAGAAAAAAPAQPVNVPPPPAMPVGDASDEEAMSNLGFAAPNAAPLNSDEAEEMEEAEVAEAAPAAAEEATAEPGVEPAADHAAAVELSPADAGAADAAAADVVPDDVAPADVIPADPFAEGDAAPVAAEFDTNGAAADPAAQ